MKKLFTFLLIGIISFNLTFASGPLKEIKLNAINSEFSFKKTEGNSFNFQNSLLSIKLIEVETKSGSFVKLLLEDYVGTKELGYPELPVLSKLVEIPKGAEIAIIVKSYSEEIIDLDNQGISKKIFPAQASLSKSQQPEDMEFYYNQEIYSTNEFIDNPIAVIDNLGFMRGVQLGRLRIHPVQYNPVTNQLRILNNLEVEVHFYNADYASTKSEKDKYYSPAFNQNFAKVINFNNANTKELIQVAPLKYVIVSDPMFEIVLQPFIQWKIKKGFDVVEAYTNNPSVGNTTSSIKAYLQNEYTSATPLDPAPSFILFVGDVAQVPTFQGSAGSHVTDLYYCEYDGNGDFYPEVYYGRFSATNNEELQSQIDKTLEYEQYLMPDPSFLGEVVMVSGVDASMASTYGNGQINYGTDNYFNLAHGITSHTYLYPASGSSASQIIADISAGVGFANYTAHCSPSGWANPSFTTSDISGLNNAHEYPLMIGNCCSSVEFQQTECFGEAVLRAENKGAIGYIGGSNSTYWNEDYWWGVGTGSISANPTYAQTGMGAYDGIFHDNSEPLSAWYVTNGQIVQAGNLAVTAAGGAEAYYWEIYHLMGDPSITTYLGVPSTLTCTHYAAIPVGTSSLTINTEEHTYVAISKDSVLLDAGIADASGVVILSFDPIMNVGPATIVATKQNRQPYMGTVDLIVNNAPFVVYLEHTIDDSLANNN
ncbi:MAG: C25 family cysteine peptidase, partial [Bacteroidota bacterium]|nr:C25 family cysteine peptidase [Bacteroidota bacterium]